jgi:hypothetical protein
MRMMRKTWEGIYMLVMRRIRCIDVIVVMLFFE